MDAVTAPQENREPGANPGRYRHCMRGGPTFDESWSLEKSEKAVWELVMRKSGELLCRLGLSRFDRRVQPYLSVLEDKWVALFLRIDHKGVKEECK